MPAYILSTMTILDPATYKRYTDVTPPIVHRHGGKFLTRGDAVTTLEGESFSERLVLIEFPSRADAEAFYNDPDYQAASKHRRAGAKNSRLILQESRPNTENPDPML
jgi:uncharacterized protein (DUF1330 family)